MLKWRWYVKCIILHSVHHNMRKSCVSWTPNLQTEVCQILMRHLYDLRVVKIAWRGSRHNAHIEVNHFCIMDVFTTFQILLFTELRQEHENTKLGFPQTSNAYLTSSKVSKWGVSDSEKSAEIYSYVSNGIHHILFVRVASSHQESQQAVIYY